VTFPKTKAVRARDETICDLLERLCRVRPLTSDESALLTKTLLRLGRGQHSWRWSRRDDMVLWLLIHRRLKNGGPKPYQPDDEVRRVAERLGRSYMAVHRRMERLRKRSKVAAVAPRKLFKREGDGDGLQSPAWTMNGHPMG